MQETDDDYVGLKYKMVHFLDRGCFSSIYLGQNTLTQEKVAIKVQNDHPEMLYHEATILNYLVRHGWAERIPRIYWFGQHKNQSCLVMNYYNLSLQDVLFTQSVPISLVSELNELMGQMLLCLQDIHKVGVIHRDIKPKNFMMHINEDETDEDNDTVSLHLIDFGMASAVMPTQHDDDSAMTSYTGNLKYMSWFVEKGGSVPARRDDLMSVGYIYVLAAVYLKLLPVSAENRYMFKSTEWKRRDNLRKLLASHSGFVAISEYLDYCYDLTIDEMPKYYMLSKLWE